MKILAVDDEYFALSMLEKAITEVAHGAVVYLCQDIQGALHVAKENKIDVAFLDIHMPGMGGLGLAKELKLINPKINIIFVTGFSEYMREGIDMRMSGYVMKPVTPEHIKTELENLRNPIEWVSESRIRAVTFGNFDLYVDKEPVKFERKQSKEILAYLIDKRGTAASYAELASIIWEDGDYDRTQQKNLQVYVASLVKTLVSVNASDILLRSRQGIMINQTKIDCDYYRFLNGDAGAVNSFTGQYMSNYSWAEFTVGYLQNSLEKKK